MSEIAKDLAKFKIVKLRGAIIDMFREGQKHAFLKGYSMALA